MVETLQLVDILWVSGPIRNKSCTKKDFVAFELKSLLFNIICISIKLLIFYLFICMLIFNIYLLENRNEFFVSRVLWGNCLQ